MQAMMQGTLTRPMSVSRVLSAKPRVACPAAMRPARSSVVPRAAQLERSLSSHSRCEISHPDGYQAYCNVVRGGSMEDGTDGFQFVVVFLGPEGEELQSAEYEFYKSDWFPTLEQCEEAIAKFDISSVMPKPKAA